MIRRSSHRRRAGRGALLAPRPRPRGQQGHRAAGPAGRDPAEPARRGPARGRGESRKELRRLTELRRRAERAPQEERVGPPPAGRGGHRRASRSSNDRVSELGEALQALKAQRGAASAPSAPAQPGSRRGGARGATPGAPPPGARRARPRAPRALQPGLRRLRAGELRPRDPGLQRVHPELPRHRLHRQCAVLDRRVPLQQEDVRRGDRGLEHALPGLPVERQDPRRPGEEGHGPRAARPQEPGPRRVPLRRGPLPQLAGGRARELARERLTP